MNDSARSAPSTLADDGDAKRTAGELGAKLFVVAGLLTIANNFIPPFEHLDRGLLFGLALSALAWGAVSQVLPWQRWSRRATLVLAVAALGHIMVGNYFGGVSAYSYGVYFVVVFVYVGVSQPPGTSFWLAGPATAAYALPALLDAGQPAVAALSATVVIPVCVLVCEVIARRNESAGAARAESERRSDLLESLAAASARMNTLETDDVLAAVVEASINLGFEAAEICMFDDDRGTYTSIHPRGLPARYVHAIHAATSGLAGHVRRQRRTQVVGDYSHLTYAVSELREDGFRSAIATPVWSEGHIPAVMIAGSRRDQAVEERDIHLFELLASMAGRALENAQRFEAERRTAERLAEVDRLKGDFISNMSHELRTPLTVIEGVGETLARRWDTLEPETRSDLIERLNRNAYVLDDIITTLLDFSRMDTGGLEVRMKKIDLGPLCASAAGRLRSLFVGHDLSVDAEPGLFVEADPMLIERVVENLLSNAARHTPAGTVVALSVRQIGDQALCEVSDNGPGISTDDLPHIGHRFFRGGDPDTRPSRGTGLGLAFTREVLARHATTLQIESASGRGSRFSFSLPLVNVEDHDHPDMSTRRPPRPQGQPPRSIDSVMNHSSADAPAGPRT